MIEETGRVVAVENGAVWVETLRKSTCQSCAAKPGCGHSLIERDRAGARAQIRALAVGYRLRLDDQVVLGIPEGALLKGAVMVYLLPLVLLFVGALLGTALSAGLAYDLAAPTGVAGLLLGLMINRRYSQRHADDETLQPKVLRLVLAPDLPDVRPDCGNA